MYVLLQGDYTYTNYMNEIIIVVAVLWVALLSLKVNKTALQGPQPRTASLGFAGRLWELSSYSAHKVIKILRFDARFNPILGVIYERIIFLGPF